MRQFYRLHFFNPLTPPGTKCFLVLPRHNLPVQDPRLRGHRQARRDELVAAHHHRPGQHRGTHWRHHPRHPHHRHRLRRPRGQEDDARHRGQFQLHEEVRFNSLYYINPALYNNKLKLVLIKLLQRVPSMSTMFFEITLV